MTEYLEDRVEQAIFLGFSIEILATTQDSDLWPGHLPFCVPRKRIQFLHWDTDSQTMRAGTAPPHANIIVYLPPRGDHDRAGFKAACVKFHKYFSPLGACT